MRIVNAFGFAAAVACGLALSAPAHAATATVQSVQGNVSIDRGTGFQQLTSAMPAEVGNRIMAAPGSSAKIVYGDGCTVEVKPGSVVSVGKESPCRAPNGLFWGNQGTNNWGVVPALIGVGGAALAYCLGGGFNCKDNDGARGASSP
jgi:hypothetical protein